MTTNDPVLAILHLLDLLTDLGIKSADQLYDEEILERFAQTWS